jgi:hypothetical protein
VIGRDGGGVEARELEATVAVWGAHHGDLAFAFDGHAAFEGKSDLVKNLMAGLMSSTT